MLGFESSRDLYVVFVDGDIAYPFSFLVKKGFKHVFIIERTALGWTCFDPNRHYLRCVLLPASWDVDVIADYKLVEPNARIIHLECMSHEKRMYPQISIMSCVSVVQYALGVYWPHVLTPWQLYTKILKSKEKHLKVLNDVR